MGVEEEEEQIKLSIKKSQHTPVKDDISKLRHLVVRRSTLLKQAKLGNRKGKGREAKAGSSAKLEVPMSPIKRKLKEYNMKRNRSSNTPTSSSSSPSKSSTNKSPSTAGKSKASTLAAVKEGKNTGHRKENTESKGRSKRKEVESSRSLF